MSLLLWARIPTLLVLWWTRLLRKPPRPIGQARVSFIVFRLDALGDLVLATPLFRELKRNYPQSSLTVVAQDAYKSVLITNPYIDKVLTVRPDRRAWLPKGVPNLIAAIRFYWRELRGRKFDVCISPRWDTDEHLATLLCCLTRAGLRVGYSERASAGKRRYNARFDRAFDICMDPGPLQHEVLRNLQVVKALGGSVRDSSIEIHLTSRDREYAHRVLQGTSDDSIVVALGIGAQAPGRRWPLERYAACVSELSDRLPLQVIVTCAPPEHSQALLLAAMIPGPAVVCDSAEIREACAVLENCDLYIGNDTGAAHLAAAMGCPAIVISRHPRSGSPEHPNSPQRFAPHCEQVRVLQPEHGLDECKARCVHIEPHCILQISVPEVLALAREMLARNRQTRKHLQASLA